MFLDADLGDSAAAAALPLIEAITNNKADMAIALLPASFAPGGGRGRVVRLAREGVAGATGFRAEQPLSGQRCLSVSTFASLRPLARGFGVETGLTIDAVRLGLRVVEVEAPFTHRVTGAGPAARLHRARQYVDVHRALWRRYTGVHLGRLMATSARTHARTATPPPPRHPGAGGDRNA